MKKTLVAHVVQAVGGGVEMAVRRIVESIDDTEFECTIIAPYEGTFRSRTGEPIRVWKIGMVREPDPLADLKALVELVYILRNTKTAIVHCHSAKGGFIGRLGARFLDLPTIYTPHAFSFLSQKDWIHRSVFLALERLARPWTNLLVASSQSEKQLGLEEVGYGSDSVTIFENAVPKWVGETKPHDNYKFNYICSIGRPSYQKNIQLLVKAFKMVKDRGHTVKCILLSSGYAPQMQEVTEQISSYGLRSDFIILENLSNVEALQILSGSRCLVLSSRYEGLPISVIEAMSLGKPVVATDVIGTRDCVTSERTGVLVPSESAVELADAIERVLTDETLYAKLSKHAHEVFSKRFCMERNIRLLEDVYRKMAEE